MYFFFFSSRRRHTRLQGDWSSDVCSSDLFENQEPAAEVAPRFFTNLCHALAEAPGRKEDQGLLAWFGQAGLVASAHMAWEQLEEPVREGLTEGFADGVRTVAAMGRNRRPRPWTDRKS